MSVYTIIGVSLSFLSAIWIPATLLCCLPWVQKREYSPARDWPLANSRRDVVPPLGDILSWKMVDRT